MFLLKKVVSEFFLPMPLCLFLCFTGLALVWWTQKQRSGRILITTGVLLLTALSWAPVADALLLPLERQYPVYARGSSPTVRFVVVLGGGHNSDPRLPVPSQLSDESLKRLVEGIRVYRQNPGSKLVLSGGRWHDPVPEARVLAEVAELLSVEASDIVIEDESKDTREEAEVLGRIVKTNTFVLVTSANHLPRSMDLFTRRGLNPLPAPADHHVKQAVFEPESLFPNGRYLRRSESVFHERAGMLWNLLHDGAGQ